MFAVGTAIRVNAYRGEAAWDVGTVVATRDIEAKPLRRLTYFYNRIPRSQFLVTVQMDDRDENGNVVYRSYYHKYLDAKPLNWLGRLARVIGFAS